MRVLNLYAGLGGNRKHWKDCEVTAVELNESIAAFYQGQYPQDRVIVADAHEYLLNHYKDFDFVWSSFPCPSHSRARFWSSKGGRYAPVFPDLGLYEEILFLRKFYSGRWVVENVIPYYKPLIKPTAEMSRHLFWSNFSIMPLHVKSNYVFGGDEMKEVQKDLGIDISNTTLPNKTKLIRNCVHPDLGLHIFNESKRVGMFEQYP